MEKIANKKEMSLNKYKNNQDHFILEKYKEYFKSYILFKKNNNIHRTNLNSMYLQFRDKYQRYIINNKNSLGLKLKGNKLFENLPLNIFKNNYRINTLNITKELENKVLEYFPPYEKKELSHEKKINGEKIKLTPIPYKNNILINTIEEKNDITEAKRSAVLMRRVEYTHLIKNFESKKIEENKNTNDKIILADKIYLLKGAIIIIEDWWKKIKNKRNKTKNSKKKILNKTKSYNNNYFYNNNNIYQNKKRKEVYIDLDTNDLISKNNIIINGSYNGYKLNNKNNYKKQNKINTENNYISNSNISKKNNSNIKNIKSTNNFNKATLVKNNANEKNILLNKSNNKKFNFSKKSESKENIKANEKIKMKKTYKKDTKINNINNNINKNIEDITNTINIDSINKIRAKIYKSISKNKNIQIKNNRNKKMPLNNSINNTYNNKSTNFKTSFNNVNDVGVKNHLKNKNKNSTDFIYNFKDIEKINNSINSNHIKKNNNHETKNKKEDNDKDTKNTLFNTERNKLIKSTDAKSRNNLEKIYLKNKYNTINNTDLNILNKNNNDKKIKCEESKENDIKFTGFNNNKNDNNNKNSNHIDKNNELSLNVNNINNDENLISFRNNEENNNNINIINDKNIKSIIPEEENILKNIIKRYRTYSYDNKKTQNKNYNDINITQSNNEIKTLNESPTIKKNKTLNFIKITKIEELSYINNTQNKKNILNILNKQNQFNNLKIIKNNEAIFIHDSLLQSQNKKNKNNKINLSTNKIQLEYKNNFQNNINIIHNQTDDSNIIPIEQDKQKIIIEEKIFNELGNDISHFYIFIQGKKSSNLNINLNNSINSTEKDISDITVDDSDFNINIPKSGDYTLCQKIKELFPSNNNIIKKEKDININNNIHNNINIKNLEINESNNFFINLDNINIKRAKSENKNNNKKNNFNFSIEIPEHIKNINKIYKTKSSKRMSNKNYKNIEFIRILENKYEFEI